MTIYTIGHSTLPLDAFVALLQAHDVDLLVDVRTVPRSRHNPQYNRESLPDGLAAVGIAYRHLPGLGGLRHTNAGSVNAGWRNASFRGYADYMATPQFSAALDELLAVAAGHVPALMCAEAVPWRCHRSLIADALLVRGLEVRHILGPGEARKHTLTPFAHVQGVQITYPADPAAAGA